MEIPSYKISLCPPAVPESGAFLNELFERQEIGPYGQEIDSFQSKLKSYHNNQSLMLCSSGTAALHLGLLSLGIQPGDVVICSTFTFAATVHAIKYCGAEPVFVDIRSEDWGVDPELLKEAIEQELLLGSKVKGVAVVHPYGIPVDLSDVSQICREKELFLLEDIAGAIGSRTKSGDPVGLVGDAAAGSFNANKLLTTGAGGFLVTSAEAQMEIAQLFANQGKVEAIHYEHSVVGMNYRMSNLNAALGLSQWPELEHRKELKQDQFKRYIAGLSGTGVKMYPENVSGEWNHWMHTGLLPDGLCALHFVENMRMRGIEAIPIWKPMHKQPVYLNQRAYLNGTAENLFGSGFVLPSGLDLSVQDQEMVIQAVEACLDLADSGQAQ